MELKDIYQLWDRFEISSATKLELDFQGLHLKLDKNQKTTTVTGGSLPVLTQPVQEVSMPAEKKAAQAPAASKEIKAPLVGVFYRASAPGEKPYVEVGQSFRKGDVIGIIEAMKSMNEIIAQEDGTVDSIPAEDSVLVEFHQTILTYH